jgi:hypothetical protein
MAVQVAEQRGLPAPSYQLVRRLTQGVNRGLLALAHHGSEASRDDFESALRREVAHPNDI